MLTAYLLCVLSLMHPISDESIPDVSGFTDHGYVAHGGGKRLSISGDGFWVGEGVVSKRGAIVVIWTEVATGRPAIGQYVYNSVDGSIFGWWGWGDEVRFIDPASEKPVNSIDGWLTGKTEWHTIKKKWEK